MTTAVISKKPTSACPHRWVWRGNPEDYDDSAATGCYWFQNKGRLNGIDYSVNPPGAEELKECADACEKERKQGMENYFKGGMICVDCDGGGGGDGGMKCDFEKLSAVMRKHMGESPYEGNQTRYVNGNYEYINLKEPRKHWKWDGDTHKFVEDSSVSKWGDVPKEWADVYDAYLAQCEAWMGPQNLTDEERGYTGGFFSVEPYRQAEVNNNLTHPLRQLERPAPHPRALGLPGDEWDSIVPESW